MTEEQHTEYTEEQIEEILKLHGTVFLQLMEYERFRIFMMTNYDVKQELDEENQLVSWNVEELTPGIANERLLDMLSEIKDEEVGRIEVVGGDALKDLDKIKVQ